MTETADDRLPMPIIMLLLPAARPIDEARLIDALKAAYPESFGDVAGTGKGQQDGPLVLTAHNLMLTVMPLPFPIPAADLEWPVQLASNQGWPTVPDVVKAHQAHVVVSAMVRTPYDDVAAYQVNKMAHALLAQLADVLADALDATALYFGQAGMLQKPADHKALAAKAFEPLPPVELYVKFHGRRTESGAIQLGTTGLSTLVGREVQTEPSTIDPRVLIEKLGGVVAYLIANGPVVKDGDTLGVSPTEKIRARFGQTDGGQRIISLSIETLDPQSA